jgi:hypothetical protein
MVVGLFATLISTVVAQAQNEQYGHTPTTRTARSVSGRWSHGRAECWKCHYRIDDLGTPFEHADHYGFGAHNRTVPSITK